MEHWTFISSRTDGHFTFRYSHTYDDSSIRDCFDDSENWYRDIESKVERGAMEWFTFRVECLVCDLVLGADYLGGNLYESIDDAMREQLGGHLADMEKTAQLQAILKLHQFADIVKERE